MPFPPQNLNAGDRYTFDIFDPSTLVQAEVQAEIIGREDIPVMGHPHPATRIRMSLRGMTQTAWIADNGELLRERDFGMRLRRAAPGGGARGPWCSGQRGPGRSRLGGVEPRTGRPRGAGDPAAQSRRHPGRGPSAERRPPELWRRGSHRAPGESRRPSGNAAGAGNGRAGAEYLQAGAAHSVRPSDASARALDPRRLRPT